MRLATVAWRGATSAALVGDGWVAAVRQLPGREQAHDVYDLIGEPLSGSEVSELEGLGEPEEGACWLPPVLRPPKNVLCVGRNYVEHVNEGARAEGRAAEMPGAPIWFTKPATALVGCGSDVVLDRDFTSSLDYEGELAVVVGKACKKLSPRSALDAVFGYTIFNDVTARDVQHGSKQWFRGKSGDTYGPCGPWVTTADEVPDPQDLRIRTTVNGEARQSDSTASMIFDVATLIADVSAGLTLMPGDIIATGTPSGVAWGMPQPVYLELGDEVAVEIEGLGRLWNRVAAGS
ncbi:MAG: fumarylacetoacetate hydrolase family protein [Acidimicrobiales bacterium]